MMLLINLLRHRWRLDEMAAELEQLSGDLRLGLGIVVEILRERARESRARWWLRREGR